MWTRLDIKERAKINFKNIYKESVIVCIIFYVIGSLLSGIDDASKNTTLRQNQGHQNYIGEEVYLDGYSDGNYISLNKDDNNDGYMGNTFTFISSTGEGIVSKFVEKLIDNVANSFSNLSSTIVIITMIIIVIITFIMRILIYNPIIVGKNNFFMGIREGHRNVGDMFLLFSNSKFVRPAVTMFFVDVFTFLWTLCLLIPGIIKSYEYRMIPYILAENPEIDRARAFELSRHMMDGQKWEAFILDLSFIGWHLLSSITLGIVGIFYVNPYVEATNAELYAVLRESAIASLFTNREELPGFDIKNN